MLIQIPDESEDDWRIERAEVLDALDQHIDRELPRLGYKPGEARGFNIVVTW